MRMAGKLIAGAVGAVKIVAGAAKHVAWYVSHQIDRRSR
jgi:hypothetical protein